VVDGSTHVLHWCSGIVTGFHPFLDVAVMWHLAIHAVQHSIFLVMWTPDVLICSRADLLLNGVLLLLKLPWGAEVQGFLSVLAVTLALSTSFPSFLYTVFLAIILVTCSLMLSVIIFMSMAFAVAVRCEIESRGSGLLRSRCLGCRCLHFVGADRGELVFLEVGVQFVDPLDELCKHVMSAGHFLVLQSHDI
jgi:hypothetical protein